MLLVLNKKSFCHVNVSCHLTTLFATLKTEQEEIKSNFPYRQVSEKCRIGSNMCWPSLVLAGRGKTAARDACCVPSCETDRHIAKNEGKMLHFSPCMAFAPLWSICRRASSYCSSLCLRYSSRYHKTEVPRFLPRVHEKHTWLQISGSLYRGTSQPYQSALSLSLAASRCPCSYFLKVMCMPENGLSFSAGGSSGPASGHEVADDGALPEDGGTRTLSATTRGAWMVCVILRRF